MEILLVLLIVALVVLLVIQFVAGGTPTRRHRLDTDRETGPRRRQDPGRSRPAGPGAEGQDPSGAQTLHPPSQSPDETGGPDARPPHRAGGSVDPAESDRHGEDGSAR